MKSQINWINLEDERPKCCIDLLFYSNDSILCGWLETYEPLEDLVFYDVINREAVYDNVEYWCYLSEIQHD